MITKDTVYHFVGIKGSGMSALALVLNDLGYTVQGSDIDQYTFTQRELEKENIRILSFSADNLHDGLTVIAGNAFQDDQIEIKTALEMGLPVVRYHQFLGELLKGYTSIGVAGAHGKTSTSGLLAHVLSGVAKTSYLVGDGTGKGIKDAQFFAFEADEYRRHFLAYSPDYLIMTNIDFDHPDYYTGIEDVFDAFQSEAYKVQKGIFAWGDDPQLRQLKANVPIYYYGTKETDDFQARNIQRTVEGSEFDAYYHDENIGHYHVPLYGEHNVLNSLAVVAVSYLEKIDGQEVARELADFKGVKRRFTEKKVADVTIIDDYAHHPSEIKATLDAARQKYPDKQIIAVFQPHTFTRTIALMDDFAASLNLADEVFLTDIFGSVREKAGKVSSADLGAKITKGGRVLKLDNMSPLLDFEQPVVVFMGAGDVQKFEYAYEELLSNLSPKDN